MTDDIKIDRITNKKVRQRLIKAINDLIGEIETCYGAQITGPISLELHLNVGIINKAYIDQRYGLKIY